jgi:hypothetical protein
LGTYRKRMVQNVPMKLSVATAQVTMIQDNAQRKVM